MYSACLFCNQRFRKNEAVETFQFGRRLAFDSQRGRLWIVCSSCARWNLSPLEERWETTDECERLYSQSRRRVATDQIGLARLTDGTELIRIGRPLRPEFAAWRYGAQIQKRRKKVVVAAGVSALVFAGAVTAPALMIGGGTIATLLRHAAWSVYHEVRKKLHPPPHLLSAGGDLIPITGYWLSMVRISPSDDAGGWELSVPYGIGKKLILQGQPAVDAATLLLPRINRTGASQGTVKDAVRELENSDSPLAYFARAEYSARKRGRGYNPIARMPHAIRLALEMATQEEIERAALERELKALEQAWKQAEEVAEIADSLAVPRPIERAIQLYRRVSGPSA